MSRARVVPLLALAALVAVGEGTAAAGEPRVLALGGAVTETVFALGGGGLLVGADQTSLFPPATASLPKVGYLRTLGAEGVLSLAPDLVLASADAGPPAALDQIAAAGVQVTRLPEAHSVAGVLERITRVGAALERPVRAAALADALQRDLDQVAADLAAVRRRPRVLFLLAVGRGAPQAAGRDTAADAMIAAAGGRNVVTGFTGYKPLSPEAALAAEPDLIVSTDQSLAAVGGATALAALPGIGPAAAGRRVVAFDGLYLLGFGPRTAHALRDLAAALHPDLGIRPLPARDWASAP